MEIENGASTLDRLSTNDQQILSRPEVHGMMLGVKPAAFEDWHGRIQDLNAVRDYFASQGVDALVHENIIVNRKATARRIAQEPDLAAEAGWTEGMDVDTFALQYLEKNEDRTELNDTLRGFLVGFPASAIRGFRKKEELRQKGVPCNILDFFEHPPSKEILQGNVDPKATIVLSELSKAYDALPKLRWEHGPNRPSKEDVDALVDRSRPAIAELYRRCWSLSDADAEALAWQKAVELRAPDGSVPFTFIVYGKNGDRAPDVIALQNQVSHAYQKT